MASHRASTKTAYDYGYRVGREEDDGGPVPDWISGNPDMLEAYDEGLRDGTDSLDAGTAPPAAHRPKPTPPRSRRSSSKPASSSTRKSSGSGSSSSGGNYPPMSAPFFPRISPTLHPDGANVAGFLLGLGLYAIGANFLRNGPAGVADWFNAKFFNKVNGQSPYVLNDSPGSSGNSGVPAVPKTPATPQAPKLPKVKGGGSGAAPKGTPQQPKSHFKNPGIPRGRKPKVAPP